MSNFKIWERFGVEMEFMIVDRDTLKVLPRADVPLGKDKDGNQLSDVEYDDRTFERTREPRAGIQVRTPQVHF